MSAYDIAIVGLGLGRPPPVLLLRARGAQGPRAGQGSLLGPRPEQGGDRGHPRDLLRPREDPHLLRVPGDRLGFEEEHGADIEWRRGGYLFVAYDEERERAFRDLLAIQRAAGLDIGWIGPEESRSSRPGLSMEGLRGGTFSPGDGYASPLKAGDPPIHSLAAAAGVEFRFGEEVTRLEMEGSRIRSDRDIEGLPTRPASIVDAAGAFAAPARRDGRGLDPRAARTATRPA